MTMTVKQQIDRAVEDLKSILCHPRNLAKKPNT